MEIQINSPNFLYDAIDAGNLKRVQRLVKVKSLDSSQVLVAIRIAMNAKIGKKVRNEIIKAFLAHPEFKAGFSESLPVAASPDLEAEVQRNSVLNTFIREGDLDLVKAVVAHPTFHAADACQGMLTVTQSVHLQKPSNEKLLDDMFNILVPKMLEDPKADDLFKKTGLTILNYAIAFRQFKTVETLLRHPETDVNECGQIPITVQPPDQKITPLMASMICRSKNNDITKILLEHPEMDVNKTDADICLPLSFILNNLDCESNFSCLELLLNDRNIDVNKKDEFYKVTPLVRLALKETYKQRERYERNLDSTGELFYEDKAFKLLLAHPKIDLEMKDEEGKNVLHHMIISILWDDKLDEGLSKHKVRFGSWYEIISDLLRTRPDLITPDNDGYTPIDIATEELRNPFHFMKDIIDNHFNNISYITKEITDKEPSKNVSNPNKISTDKEPSKTVSNPDKISTDKEPSKTLSNPDKISTDKELSKTLSDPEKISTDKEPPKTVSNPDKISTDKEPPKTVSNPDKISSDKEPPKTVSNPNKISTDKEPPKVPSKTVSNPHKICWNCNAEDVKLYKCTGCKKAYYCSRSCITQDWEIHGGYCVKKQQKRKNRKSQ